MDLKTDEIEVYNTSLNWKVSGVTYLIRKIRNDFGEHSDVFGIQMFFEKLHNLPRGALRRQQLVIKARSQHRDPLQIGNVLFRGKTANVVRRLLNTRTSSSQRSGGCDVALLTKDCFFSHSHSVNMRK